MKNLLSKVLVSVMIVGMIVGTLSIGCSIEQKRSEKLMREQINQIRLSDGYIPKN
jgi:hypothetical protein